MERADEPLKLIEQIDLIHQYAIHPSKSIIYISGPIEGDLATALRMKVAAIDMYREGHNLPLEDVNINILSPGGDAGSINALYDFYDELLSQGRKVNIHAEGICMSAATLIVGGASGKRTCGKRCRFMVHEIQIENVGGTGTQTKSISAEIERMGDEYLEAYVKVCNRDKELTPEAFEKEKLKWEKLSTKETYFGADKAKELGLIDEVR